MLKFKSKVLIMIITALMIVLLFQISSNATSGDNLIILGPGTTTSTPSPTPTATPTSTPTATSTPASQTKLPQTGIEDYPGIIIAVVVFGGLALYSYKKIKDYDKI